MPTIEISLTAVNLFLLFCLSRMVRKNRAARQIATRLLTDDVFYHEARDELVKKNVESARLVWGRIRVGAITQIPKTVPQDPQAAWHAALHTSMRVRQRAGVRSASASARRGVPDSLWVTTLEPKDTPWSPTVAMTARKPVVENGCAKRVGNSRDFLELPHAIPCK